MLYVFWKKEKMLAFCPAHNSIFSMHKHSQIEFTCPKGHIQNYNYFDCCLFEQTSLAFFILLLLLIQFHN